MTSPSSMSAVNGSLPSVSNNETSTETVVTWHVLIWALLSLAINSVAQPARCYLCLAFYSKYRLYLCMSPFACLSDTISILFSVILTQIRLGVSFKAAIRFVRLKNLYNNPDSTLQDQFESLDHRHWLRAVVFIIGTLPAFIKLASFSGVPWSKTWGMMFGLSFIINEFLNICSIHKLGNLSLAEERALDFVRDPKEFDDDDVDPAFAKDLSKVWTRLTYVDLCFTLVTLLAQMTVMIWALRDIVDVTLFKRQPLVSKDYEIFGKLLWVISVFTVLALAVLILASKLIKARLKFFVSMKELFGGLLLSLLWSTPTSPKFLGSKYWGKILNECSIWLLEIHLFCMAVCLVYVLCWWICLIPKVGKILFVTNLVEAHQGTKKQEEPTKDTNQIAGLDREGVFLLALFLLHLSITIAWYGICYDPTGTRNPSWTSVFG